MAFKLLLQFKVYKFNYWLIGSLEKIIIILKIDKVGFLNSTRLGVK
jgi:hypothetical protein